MYRTDPRGGNQPQTHNRWSVSPRNVITLAAGGLRGLGCPGDRGMGAFPQDIAGVSTSTIAMGLAGAAALWLLLKGGGGRAKNLRKARALAAYDIAKAKAGK